MNIEFHSINRPVALTDSVEQVEQNEPRKETADVGGCGKAAGLAARVARAFARYSSCAIGLGSALLYKAKDAGGRCLCRLHLLPRFEIYLGVSFAFGAVVQGVSEIAALLKPGRSYKKRGGEKIVKGSGVYVDVLQTEIHEIDK